MEDKLLQVKVETEIFEKFEKMYNEIKEISPMTKKEYITRMINEYELNQIKTSVPMLEPSINMLQSYTAKINDLFKHVADSMTVWKDKYIDESGAELQNKESTIQLLQQQNSSLKSDLLGEQDRVNEFMKYNEVTHQREQELQEQIKQLNNSIQDKSFLIDEYKAKNDNLNGMLLEYTAQTAENKELKQSISSITTQSQIQAVELLKEQSQNSELQKKISELQEANTKAIELLKREFAIEKENALLVLKQEHNIVVDTLRNEYANKIHELLKLDNKQPQPTQTTTIKNSSGKSKKDNINTVKTPIE